MADEDLLDKDKLLAPNEPAPQQQPDPDPEPDDDTPKETSAEEGIERFKARLAAAEEARRTEAEGRRNAEEQLAQQREENARSQAYGIDGQISQLKSAREAVTQKVIMIRRDLADANARGDYEKAAELMEAMTDHKVYVAQIDNGIRNFEYQKQQRPQQVQPQRQPAPQQQPQQIRDLSFEEQVKLWPESPSKRWAETNAHRFRDDDRAVNRMLAAHHEAVGKRIPLESPEYFEHIEGYMDKFGSETKRAPAPTPSAPPTRQRTVNGGGQITVRLTRDQKNMARSLGMSEDRYAAQVANLIAEGKMKQ